MSVKEAGLTVRQMKAADKLSLYQRGWHRLTKLAACLEDQRNLNAAASNRETLIEKSNRYVSPRDDCLSSFYETS